MNCAYHHNQEVRGVCSTCGRPICEECMVDLNGQVHCKQCLAVRMQRPSREVHGFVRFVLSLVPGIGHLYMGMFNRGVQLAVGAVVGAWFLDLLLPNSPFSGLFIAGMVFLSVFDAREAHLRIQQGLEVEDKGFVDIRTLRFTWNSRYIGYGLVGLGALALYRTFIYDTVRLFINDSRYYQLLNSLNQSIFGLAAVAAGIWLLRKNMKSH